MSGVRRQTRSGNAEKVRFPRPAKQGADTSLALVKEEDDE
ncbi:hypothetical protein AG0111_0g12487 [Alternaria gaisen]|uniref:Uncharacterized protein n=1 Tax=Alternaria gaisen TaxID=167740 RepID=A0ACB6F4E2_9PLEO|nr:hypothetical protein AG0111_0g12487 [Alternaria gaisen]